MPSQSPFREQQEFATATRKGAVVFTGLGRIFLALSFFALLGAWVTQLTREPLLGMSQTHLFCDAIVLALLGIGCLIDAFMHERGY